MNLKSIDKRLVIAGGAMIAVIILGIILAISDSNKKLEDRKVDEIVLKDSPSTIANGDQLYKYINNYDTFVTFRADLGKLSREFYKSKNTEVFTVVTFSEENGVGKMTGTLGKNQLTFELTRKPNDQFTIDAKDSTGKDVSDKFSNNSARSKFIQTLPLESQTCTISYEPDSRGIVATMKSLAEQDRLSCESYINSQTNSQAGDIIYQYPTYLNGTTPGQQDTQIENGQIESS